MPALPVTGMRINIGDARQLPASTEARRLYDAVEAHFPPGTGVSPVTVVLRPGTDAATADRTDRTGPPLRPGAEAGSRGRRAGPLLADRGEGARGVARAWAHSRRSWVFTG